MLLEYFNTTFTLSDVSIVSPLVVLDPQTLLGPKHYSVINSRLHVPTNVPIQNLLKLTDEVLSGVLVCRGSPTSHSQEETREAGIAPGARNKQVILWWAH